MMLFLLIYLSITKAQIELLKANKGFDISKNSNENGFEDLSNNQKDNTNITISHTISKINIQKCIYGCSTTYLMNENNQTTLTDIILPSQLPCSLVSCLACQSCVTKTAQVTLCPIVSTKTPKAILKKILGPNVTIYISRTTLSDCTKIKTVTERLTVTTTTTILKYGDFITINRIALNSNDSMVSPSKHSIKTEANDNISKEINNNIEYSYQTSANSSIETNVQLSLSFQTSSLKEEEMMNGLNTVSRNSCSTIIVCPAERFSCPNQVKGLEEVKAIISSPDTNHNRSSRKTKRNMNGAFVD